MVPFEDIESSIGEVISKFSLIIEELDKRQQIKTQNEIKLKNEAVEKNEKKKIDSQLIPI